MGPDLRPPWQIGGLWERRQGRVELADMGRDLFQPFVKLLHRRYEVRSNIVFRSVRPQLVRENRFFPKVAQC